MTAKLVDLVTEQAGHFNVDVLAGWEAGLLGKQRLNGRYLVARLPPAHLTDARAADWYTGHDAASRYRQRKRRETRFLGHDGTERVVVVRKGWIARAKVLTQMERAGARGLVIVVYMENVKDVRTVKCYI